MSEPLVSAVIVTHNGAGHLRNCLPSLLAQSYKALEIIVVDNASSDESAEVASQFGVRWAPLLTNVGLAPALNHGAALANGELLLFLNNDMRFHEKLVASLADPLIHDNTVFATDALQNSWDEGEPVHTVTRLAKAGRASQVGTDLVPGLSFHQEPSSGMTDALFASAACMMARRTYFRELGGFDERLTFGYEDVEICWRASLCGWRIVFVPQAICWHRVGASSRSAQAALLSFSGIIRGRLVLSTKLLPLRFALCTWCITIAGAPRDLFRGQIRYAMARAQILFRTAQQIPELIQERKSLYADAKKTAEQQVNSLLRHGDCLASARMVPE